MGVRFLYEGADNTYLVFVLFFFPGGGAGGRAWLYGSSMKVRSLGVGSRGIWLHVAVCLVEWCGLSGSTCQQAAGGLALWAVLEGGDWVME